MYLVWYVLHVKVQQLSNFFVNKAPLQWLRSDLARPLRTPLDDNDTPYAFALHSETSLYYGTFWVVL